MCAHHIHVSRSVNVNREQHFTSAYRGPVTHTHTRTTYHIQTAHSYECRTGTVKHIYLINCTRVQVIVTHVKKYLYLYPNVYTMSYVIFALLLYILLLNIYYVIVCIYLRYVCVCMSSMYVMYECSFEHLNCS